MQVLLLALAFERPWRKKGGKRRSKERHLTVEMETFMWNGVSYQKELDREPYHHTVGTR